MTGAAIVLLTVLAIELALRDGAQPFKLLGDAASGKAKLVS